MQTTKFNRDSMARWYAKQHLLTDPGVVSIYYLPRNAPEREIRFLEVNKLIGEQTDDALEPIDFGVDAETENAHRLLVLDVTPRQLKRIQRGALPLPEGWTLEGVKQYGDE